MSEKYEVTKEAILAMSTICPEAEKMLKAGFPEAFADKKHFDLMKLKNSLRLFTHEEAQRAGFKDNFFMQIRGRGGYAEIAFYLSEEYLKWHFLRDDGDRLCLTVEPR